MEGLMFPKTQNKKKRKKHKKSILQDQSIKQCFLCMLEGDYRVKPVHNHHIFYGKGMRNISEEEGIKVNLCVERHHQYGKESVHGNPGDGNDLILKMIGQKAYEKTHSRQEFMDRFKKNYL